MKIIDFTQNTLKNIQNTMDFNGYSHFHLENYKAKNDKPCFIPENADRLQEVQSWKSLFKETLETVKTVDFLQAVAENYDAPNLVDALNGITVNIGGDNTIDYNDVYLEVTKQTPEQFAEDFMDSYFLGGDEVWCSLSTKLQDYMM